MRDPRPGTGEYPHLHPRPNSSGKSRVGDIPPPGKKSLLCVDIWPAGSCQNSFIYLFIFSHMYTNSGSLTAKKVTFHISKASYHCLGLVPL